jgi:hypothetical protein
MSVPGVAVAPEPIAADRMCNVFPWTQYCPPPVVPVEVLEVVVTVSPEMV